MCLMWQSGIVTLYKIRHFAILPFCHIKVVGIVAGKLSILTSRLKNSRLGQLLPPEASKSN